MAAAPLPPEDLDLYFLLHPDPSSPSVFLDLPPTPTPTPTYLDDDDDMVLPYISHLLMEAEDAHAESFFYQYPDHPALLHAQQPFADILADAAAPADSSSGCGATTSPSSVDTTDAHGDAPQAQAQGTSDSHHSPNTNWRDANADMATSAFLKGVQEATKLLPLPTNNATLLLHDARGRKNMHAAARDNDDDDGSGDPESRRATKLMLPAQTADEAEARRMFDEMMIHERDDVCINMKGVQQQDLASTDATDTTQKAKTRRRPRRRSSTTAGTGSGSNDGPVDLHTLLLRCAQAVATDNRGAAQDLLAHIRRHSSPTGDATQRLAHYFAEGLEARLAGTGSRLYHSLMLRRTSVADFLRAYRLYMAACCCKKVAFIFSNRTIHYAVAVAAGSGKRRLHIVDYGLGYGFQWPGLLRGLAVMNGGPPELVRITGIDLPQPGFRPAQQIEDTGRRLSDCARQLGVPFKFRGIAAKRESVSPEDLDIDPVAEVVVVISLCHFRLLTDEIDISATAAAVPRRSRPSPRDQVLGNIRQMRPDVFIHGVVSGGYGTTYFSTRFREALFHYSAQFDLLDATVPRDSPERLLVERDIFGHAAMNIVACEGTDRVERPETYRHWQAKNRRAGLRQLPLQAGVVKVVMDKVKDNYHRDFVVDEDQGWLLHRWKGRVLYGLSTWVAS